MLLILGLVLVALIVFFYEAQRRVPVQYARSLFRGGRMYRQSGRPTYRCASTPPA